MAREHEQLVRDTKIAHWLNTMGRARARYEAGMEQRRKCFQFNLTQPAYRYYERLKPNPIVPEHLDARIRWHKAWLDYGQAIGESEMFTAAVSTAHHPRRI